MALDLDPYVKKLLNARRRVVLVNNILQNAQVCEFILLFSLFCLGTPHYTFLNFPTVPLSAVVQTALQYMTQSRSQPSSLLFTGALATAEPQRCQGNGTQEDHAGDVGSFHTSFPQQALMQLTSSHLQRLRLHHNTLSWLGTLPSGFWGGGALRHFGTGWLDIYETLEGATHMHLWPLTVQLLGKTQHVYQLAD